MENKVFEPEFLLIDLFCGFGGTTLGFEKAGNTIVVACVNHDPAAIKSHWLNHPNVEHFEEDIRTLELTRLVRLVEIYRAFYPNAKVVLWASLECTNYSKAKGGLARDADSRTLAEHLHRYQNALQPDIIQIENVVEFMDWGPMRIKPKFQCETHTELTMIIDKKTKQDKYGWEPIPQLKGTDWKRWRKEFTAYGYSEDWKELNSADFGAFTSRNRLFGIFSKVGIAWPVTTHAKNSKKNPGLKPWNAVKHCLDFEDKGRSIFNRKIALSPNTMKRIYAGLVKFVANGDANFLSLYYSGKPEAKNKSTNSAAGTITTVDHHSLVQTFILKYNSMSQNGNYNAPSIEEPCPVISTQNRIGVVNASFLQHYYGNGFCTNTSEPCPTITTKDRAGLVQTHFISRDFKTPTHSSIESPAGTITTVPKMNLVQVDQMIYNPAWGGSFSSTEKPCVTIVARQDKAPLYLLQINTTGTQIPVYEGDCEMTIKIKEFMLVYNISDITMRMLKVPELLKIQGFPANYQMVGKTEDHKKFIGNSVEPNTVAAWVKCLGNSINSTTHKQQLQWQN